MKRQTVKWQCLAMSKMQRSLSNWVHNCSVLREPMGWRLMEVAVSVTTTIPTQVDAQQLMGS